MVNDRSYVKIDDDGMGAWLYLYEPDGQDSYTKEEIIQFLKANDISHGYNESNIAAICKKKIYEREIRVAKGTSGKEGHSGYFEYFFETDAEKLKKPTVNANGSVDYKSINLIQNVKRGDLVARYHPSIPGEDGMDVTGKPIKAPEVRELKPVNGKGVTSGEDPNDYIAAIDGRIEYANDKITIEAVHYINGDADLATNAVIEFNGDIVIQGGVEAGVVIRAGKNVSVDGVVEAADIVAGGDIVIKRGIQGNNTGKVVSTGGDVIALFIEHATVEAAKNVQANVIMNSKVKCDGKVLLEGKKGQVFGGYTHGLLGIKAVIVGNDVDLKTVLHTGCEPSYYEMKLKLTKKINDLTEEFEKIVNELKGLLKNKQARGQNKENVEKLAKNNSRRAEIEEEIKNVKEQMSDMEVLEREARASKIRIEGNVHRGTVISIGNHELMIDRDTSYMEYSNQNGLIEGEVIVLN